MPFTIMISLVLRVECTGHVHLCGLPLSQVQVQSVLVAYCDTIGLFVRNMYFRQCGLKKSGEDRLPIVSATGPEKHTTPLIILTWHTSTPSGIHTCRKWPQHYHLILHFCCKIVHKITRKIKNI